MKNCEFIKIFVHFVYRLLVRQGHLLYLLLINHSQQSTRRIRNLCDNTFKTVLTVNDKHVVKPLFIEFAQRFLTAEDRKYELSEIFVIIQLTFRRFS